ncbi:PREDICTED: alpha-N-acetylgalactosaminide alpha-2,6-sialyltransferase 2, partial [Apaloderma vittatum]|uniref:alpha-N-acetylgalactosaminide alpha-2,6-sialyltransferase 2 n=1 Tax=Apaloderma vittatum TaxID=57397 RepID=UPI000521C56B
GKSLEPSAELEDPKPSRKQPRVCRRSVMARAKADPKYGEIFRFDTPVLMWDQHFTPETWDRLKTRHVPYGWQGLSHAVKGFEEDVGTKISFYGFTVNTMKNSLIAYEEYGFTQIPQGKELRYIFIPSDVRDYVMLKSAIQGSPVPEGSDKGDKPQKYFGPEASAEKFKLLHPDFLQYLTARFLRSELLDTQYSSLYMPSTGALMLLTALHTCDQMMLEAALWRSLHRAGIMTLYQR